MTAQGKSIRVTGEDYDKLVSLLDDYRDAVDCDGEANESACQVADMLVELVRLQGQTRMIRREGTR